MIALLTLVAALQSAPDPADAPRAGSVVIATRDSVEARRRQTLSVIGYRPPPGGLPEDQQTALFAVDFDGYGAGRCWARLPGPERARLEAARARFHARPAGQTAPILDQIFQSGFTRGQIETQDELPDADLCETMRENAPIALADLSDALAAFEAALPAPLRRRP